MIGIHQTSLSIGLLVQDGCVIVIIFLVIIHAVIIPSMLWSLGDHVARDLPLSSLKHDTARTRTCSTVEAKGHEGQGQSTHHSLMMTTRT